MGYGGYLVLHQVIKKNITGDACKIKADGAIHPPERRIF
jgi:hypothetical protein